MIFSASGARLSYVQYVSCSASSHEFGQTREVSSHDGELRCWGAHCWNPLFTSSCTPWKRRLRFSRKLFSIVCKLCVWPPHSPSRPSCCAPSPPSSSPPATCSGWVSCGILCVLHLSGSRIIEYMQLDLIQTDRRHVHLYYVIWTLISLGGYNQFTTATTHRIGVTQIKM